MPSVYESKLFIRICLCSVYLARIRLKRVHEQKRTKRTLSTEYRRNTSDIRDLLDSKLSGNSPPRAVAWHSFLVAVNFPLIVVQSIGLHVVAREGMHGRRKKHTALGQFHFAWHFSFIFLALILSLRFSILCVDIYL